MAPLKLFTRKKGIPHLSTHCRDWYLHKSDSQSVWPMQCFICTRVTLCLCGYWNVSSAQEHVWPLQCLVPAQLYKQWSPLYLQIGCLRISVRSTRCFLRDMCTAHCRWWHRDCWWSDGTPRPLVRFVGAGCFPVAARHPSARWFWVAGGIAPCIPGSVRHPRSGKILRGKTINDLWLTSEHLYGSR
jgi:hypothetical protein